MKKVILLAVFSALTTGCGSVSQPVADIPLVDNESLLTPRIGIADPHKMSQVIETSQIDTNSVTIGRVSYTVGKTFYSASGKNCKFLSSALDRKLYCYNDESSNWQQIDNVIVETNINNQDK